MIADMTAEHGYRLIPARFAVDSSGVLPKNTTRRRRRLADSDRKPGQGWVMQNGLRPDRAAYARRERPRSRAAEQRDELAPF